MKRFFSIVLILFLSISLFYGCNKNNINDKDTGKIKEYKIKYEYVNGTYYIFAEKFDDYGKAPYMSLKVNNNIITNIYFNYMYKDGTLYINEDDKNDLWFYIKTLNTSVLQNQESTNNPNENYEEVYKTYNELLTSGLKLIKDGNSNISYVNFSHTYTEQENEYDKFGYKADLKVTYERGVISKVSFTKKDKTGNIITSNSSYLKSFRDINNINYQRYIQNILDLSIGKEKVVLSLNNLDVDKEYNKLAKKINNKIINFDYTKYKIFKNI